MGCGASVAPELFYATGGGTASRNEAEEEEPKQKRARIDPYDPNGALLRDLLVKANVALVRVGYLHDLSAEAVPLPRRQEMPAEALLPGSQLNCTDEGFHGLRLYVVSHAWLTEEHPDPTGVRLNELCDALEAQNARETDVVFLDYCSLWQEHRLHRDWAPARGQLKPGHPARRTPEEEAEFRAAQEGTELIFGSGQSRVIVLTEIHMLQGLDRRFVYTKNVKAYAQRGWCRLELAVAQCFGRVANRRTAPKLPDVLPTEFRHLVSSRKLAFSTPGDGLLVLELYKKYYYAGQKEALLEAIKKGMAEEAREGIDIALSGFNWHTVVALLKELAAVKAGASHEDTVSWCLATGNAFVRMAACRALTGDVTARHAQQVADHLLHHDFQVRRAACQAFAEMGPARSQHAKSVWRAACRDPDFEVREEAKLTLQLMGRGDLLRRVDPQPAPSPPSEQPGGGPPAFAWGGAPSPTGPGNGSLRPLAAQLGPIGWNGWGLQTPDVVRGNVDPCPR